MQNSGYAPVQIRNPVSKNHIVRLHRGQKITLVFNRPEFRQCSVNISGDFLLLDEIVPIRNGWSATISQTADISSHDVTHFLGEVNVLDAEGVVASLCVLTESNGNFFKIVQPNDSLFRLEPHQVLDVLFYAADYGEQWSCEVGAGELRLEQIAYTTRPWQETHLLGRISEWAVEEHHFRFRLDSSSVELVQSLPNGKYNGGRLLFSNGLQRSNLSIVYNWRQKKTVYKALLLPKQRNDQHQIYRPHYKKKPKQLMQAEVILKRIEYGEDDLLDAGCNVIFTKCR